MKNTFLQISMLLIMIVSSQAQSDRDNGEDTRRPKRHPKIGVEKTVQKVVEKEIVCPVSGTKFKVYKIENPKTDSQNLDSDGNPYYRGTDPSDYEVQVSPATLYACETSEMLKDAELKSQNKEPIKAETIKKLIEVLEPYKKKHNIQDQRKLENWTKMELAAVCYEARGASDEKVAKYYQKAAWAVRKRIAWRTLYTEFKDPESIITEIDRLESAVSRVPVIMASSIHRLLLLLSHRSGFNNARDIWIEFIKTNSKNRLFLKEINQIQTLINLEKSYMEKSLEFVEKAITKKETKNYDLLYTKADLLRRTGKKDDSKALLKQLVEDKATPNKIIELSSFILKNIDR